VRDWLTLPFRVALRLLPGRLRREHGAEMTEHHARLVSERWSESGAMAALRAAMRDTADVVVTSIRERWAVRRRRSGRFPGNDHAVRSQRGSTMDRLVQDVRFTVRSWTRNPGFALVSMVTLALAIGANTAIFTVVDAVLLEPLPYREPGQLVMVSQTLPQLNMRRAPVSYPNFEDWRRDARSFSDMAAFRTRIPRTLLGEQAEQIAGAESTANLFELLGVQAQLGRTFSQADVEGGEQVIVLSSALWQRDFGGDPGILGRTITLSGQPYVVSGVMPPWFDFPSRQDEYWIPLPQRPGMQDRDTHFLQVVARLSPGAALASARSEMQSLFDRMRVEYPQVFGTRQPTLETRREVVSGAIRPTLLMLVFTVGLLLLVACANLANLVLMRATGRSHELAVRSAMGAQRRHLMRQLLTESAMLAMVGGALGAVVALVSTRMFLTWAPDSIPRRTAIHMDARALAFTAAISLLSAMVFGVLPSLRSVRTDGSGALRDTGRGGPGRRVVRLQRALVVTQVGLAFMLLTGAGLLVNSLGRLMSKPAGLDPQGVISFRIAPTDATYPSYARKRALFDAVLDQVRALPGVTSTGASWALPFAAGYASGRIVPEGATVVQGEEPTIGLYPILGDYFETLRIPLQRGRTFTPADNADAPTVVIINQAAADRFWPGEDPVGKRFKRGSVDEIADAPWVTVVGVVGSTSRSGLGEPIDPESYWPHAQAQWASEMYIVARTSGDPLSLADPVRAIVHRTDAALPVTDVRTMPARILMSVAQPRFRTFLASVFAILGGILAVVGIYGVLGYAVAQRTREIGVRMALGARRSTVLRGVLLEGTRLIAAGLLIGGAGAFVAGRIASGLLFEISPLDPATWTAVAVLLSVGAILACLVPAGRASRVAPQVALRDD
jgi:putative ABC transport system permease protein